MTRTTSSSTTPGGYTSKIIESWRCTCSTSGACARIGVHPVLTTSVGQCHPGFCGDLRKTSLVNRLKRTGSKAPRWNICGSIRPATSGDEVSSTNGQPTRSTRTARARRLTRCVSTPSKMLISNKRRLLTDSRTYRLTSSKQSPRVPTLMMLSTTAGDDYT
jgi:hypothetical protein